jgi:hypothetical protein
MPAVNIPNLGTVNFPDTMTQEEIIDVIKTKILPTIGKQQEAAQPEQTTEKPQVEAPAVAVEPVAAATTAPVVAPPQAAAPITPAQQVSEVEAPANKTGILQGVKDFLTAPLPVSEDERFVAGRLKTGIQNLSLIPAKNSIAELTEIQEGMKERLGPNLEKANEKELADYAQIDKDIRKYQGQLIEAGVERKKTEKEYGVSPLQKKIEGLTDQTDYKDADFIDKSKKFGELLGSNLSEIPGYIASIGLESLPQSMAMMAMATLTRFLPGGPSKAAAATAAGASSSFMEFGSNYADMREQGMSHEEAWEKAAVKSNVVGFFDAVSFGAAGKAASQVMSNFEKGAVKEALKTTAKETTKQGLYGAAGEGVGSYTVGEDVDPAKMAAEFAGEFFMSPVEGASSIREYQEAATPYQQAEAAKQAALQKAANMFKPSVPVQSATGETIPLAPLDAAQKQEQAVATGQAAPPIAATTPAAITPDDQKLIDNYAKNLVDQIGMSPEDAIAVAKGEFERGDLRAAGSKNTGAVNGAGGAGVSVPNQQAAAAQGTTTPNTQGLAGAVGAAAGVDAGKTGEPAALAQTTADLRAQIKGIESSQDLLRLEGKPPKAGTRRAKRFDALEVKRQELITQWSQADAAEQAAKKGQAAPAQAAAAAPVEQVAATPAVVEDPKLVEQRDTLAAQIRDVEAQQMALLQKNGKRPHKGSKKAIEYERLGEQRQQVFDQWSNVHNQLLAAKKASQPTAEATPVEETPPAPATFAQLDKKQKIETNQRAKELWQAREINLPIESSWDNLPKWKRDAFAQQVYEGGENFTSAANFAEGTPYVKAMDDIAALPAKASKKEKASEFVGPKRPPGRPVTQRTAAGQAANEANRAADRVDINRARRAVDQMIVVANKQPDVMGTAEQQQASAAQIASDRKVALYNLFLATKNKYTRGVESSGLKAKAFLESEAVTLRERKDLQDRFEFEQKQREQGTQRSAMDTPVTDPYSAESLLRDIDDFIGIETGNFKLNVVQSWSDLPTQVRLTAEADGGTSTDKGFVLKGKAYLIADNIQQGSGRAVFMHEVGVHLGLQGLLPAALLNKLVGQIRTWAQRNDGSIESRIAQEALDNVERAGTSLNQQNTEAIAYFLEGAINAGITPQAVKANTEFGKFIQQVYNLLRNAIRKLGLATDKITAQDIVDMTFGAARLEMANRWHGTAATFRNFNHMFLSTGEGMGKLMAGQAFGGGSYFAERYGIAKGYFRKDIKNKAKQGQVLEGNMMRVDFKIAPDEWLQWFKPVSEQSALVQEKLREAKDSGFFGQIARDNEEAFQALTGEQIVTAVQERTKSALYQVNIFDKIPAVVEAIKNGNYKVAASMYLNSLGIKGTKFADASSRTEYDFIIETKGGAFASIEDLEDNGILDSVSAGYLVASNGDLDNAYEAAQQDMFRAEDAGNVDDYGTAQIAHDQLNHFFNTYKQTHDATDKTNNYVVYDDQNIIRVASQRGADQERTQFSKNFNVLDEVTMDEADPAFARFTSPTQALNYIQRSGTDFERVLAGKLKSVVKGVAYVVVNNASDIPNVQVYDVEKKQIPLSEAFENTSGMYAESMPNEQGEVQKFILLRGMNFGDPALQGLGSNMMLHESLHAGTIEKLSLYDQYLREGRPIPPDLQRLVIELNLIMSRAQDRYLEMKAEALIGGPPIPEQLKHLFEDVQVGTDTHEFVSYGLTDSPMQQFLLGVEGKAVKGAAGYFKSLFTRFANALRQAYGMDDKHTSALQDLILVTGALLEGQKTVQASPVTSAMAARKRRSISLTEYKLTRSNANTPQALNAIGGLGKLVKNADKLVELFDRRLDRIHPKVLQALVKFIPSPVMLKWLKTRLPSLLEVSKTVERMHGMRSKLIAGAKVIADDMAAFIRSDKQAIVVLGDALHLSRLNDFSPLTYINLSDALINDQKLYDAQQKEQQLQRDYRRLGTDEVKNKLAAARREVTVRENQIKDVYVKWNELGKFKDGQDIYRRVLTYYKDTFAAYRHMLDLHIANLRIPGKPNDPTSPKGRLMAEINKMYVMEMPEAYAPFMRRGDYRLDFDGERGGRETQMFESSSAREDFIANEAIKRNLSRSEFFTSNNVKITDKNTLNDVDNELRNSSELLKGIFQVLDEETKNAPLTQKGVEELKDSIYQFWLKSGPENSIRKQFMHSRNVAGFSADVYQNFVDYSTRAAIAISRMRYQDDIYAQLERAEDALVGNPLMNKLQVFIDEIGSQAKQELNPPEQTGLSLAARKFKQYTFMYAMTSVATALIQMLGLVGTVMPFVVGEYGVTSAATLAKYMGVMTGNVGWTIGKDSMSLAQYVGDKLNISKNGDVKFVAPTLAESDYIKNDPFRLKAYQELVARGAIDNTFISNITEMNKAIPKESDYKLVRGMNIGATAMTASFNTLERLTRQVSLMSIFELEYKRSGNFDDAITAAIDKTNKYVGNANTFNTPAAFKGPIGSVLWQFKQFPLGIFTLLSGLAYQMLRRHSDLAERGVAAKMLATFYLTTFMFAGVQGLPGYSAATGVIDLTLNHLIPIVSRAGVEERIARNPATAYSSDRRFREEWLPEMFGTTRIKGLDGRYHDLSEVAELGPTSVLSGWNISSRMSMDGLLWRSSRTGNTWSESALNFAKANFAPGAGIGMSFIDGVQQLIEGDIYKGLLNITPAPVKSVIAAYRLADEGLTTNKNAQILAPEELGRFAIAGQAIGFQPTEVARIKKQEGNKIEEEMEVRRSKAKALDKVDKAILDQNASSSAMTNALNVWRQHNLRYAAYPDRLLIPIDSLLKHVDDLIDDEKVTNIRGQKIKDDMLQFQGRERMRVMPQPRGEQGSVIKKYE